jgi:hypothetical protein
MMKDYLIGELNDEDKFNTPEKNAKKWGSDSDDSENSR